MPSPGTAIVMSGRAFPSVVPLISWLDPVVDRIGFRVINPYVEIVWLPVLGPSATWMLRRLDSLLPDDSAHAEIDLDELGHMLGLTAGSSVQRTMSRLVRFGLAEWSGVLRVRRSVPPLPSRQLSRLPARVREAHAALIAGRSVAWVAVGH